LFLVEDAEAWRAWLAGIELCSGAWSWFGATGLELRKRDGEFGAVADALFYYRENGDAGKVREEMF
jgi:hypothetical protein